MRAQHHLLGFKTRERQEAFLRLANSFIEGDWYPEGMTREDVEAIPDWMIRNIVLNTANGLPIGGYEVKIHELYQQLHEGGVQADAPLPQVSNPWRSGPRTRARPNPSRRLP